MNKTSHGKITAAISILFIIAIGTPACDDPRSDAPKGAIKVGLLLPFTGEEASKGINYERAVTQLVETINDRGGIDGRPIWIEARDTHSNIENGMKSVIDLIKNENVIALIGPGDVALIQKMAPLVKSSGIPHILPEMVSSEALSTTDGWWFRIAPSIELMGCSLAQEMYNKRHRRIFIIHSDKMNDEAMADGIIHTLDWYHHGETDKAVSYKLEINENAVPISQLYSQISEFAPDVIVVITSPFAGSQIVQGLAFSLENIVWYLGPGLGSKVLFDNIPPDALDGAHVVSTEIADRLEGDNYQVMFKERWNDDIPFEMSYFYYDALAMLSIASERAAKINHSALTKAQLVTQLQAFSSTPGNRVNWNELVNGLEDIRSGQPVDYYGLTGPLTLNAEHSVDSALSIFRLYEIESNRLVFSTNVTCSQPLNDSLVRDTSSSKRAAIQ